MFSNFDQLLNYTQKFTFLFLSSFFFKILFQILIFYTTYLSNFLIILYGCPQLLHLIYIKGDLLQLPVAS